jgi:uncharacterized membrane protein (GlpM family)
MFYFIFKTLVTASIIAAVSEISKRFTFLASLLASLPLTSLLIFLWMYFEQKDVQKISAMSQEIFYLVIPSLAFFILLPFFLRSMNFFSALALDIFLTYGIYVAYIKLLRILKPDVGL